MPCFMLMLMLVCHDMSRHDVICRLLLFFALLYLRICLFDIDATIVLRLR